PDEAAAAEHDGSLPTKWRQPAWGRLPLERIIAAGVRGPFPCRRRADRPAPACFGRFAARRACALRHPPAADPASAPPAVGEAFGRPAADCPAAGYLAAAGRAADCSAARSTWNAPQ